MPKNKTKAQSHSVVKSTSHHKKSDMDKVKIKRVARNKKKTTTAEKIMAGIGVGTTLLGGASSVAPKTNQTQFVRTQETNSSSTADKIKSEISKIFGATFGAQVAKADFEAGADSTVQDSGTAVATPVVLSSDSSTDNSGVVDKGSAPIVNQKIADQSTTTDNLNSIGSVDTTSNSTTSNQNAKSDLVEAGNDTAIVTGVTTVADGGGTGATVASTSGGNFVEDKAVSVGATVTQQTGAQGTYTLGTVNGQSVALLGGAVYDSNGNDITSTFSDSQLADIKSKLAAPTPTTSTVTGVTTVSDGGGTGAAVASVTSGVFAQASSSGVGQGGASATGTVATSTLTATNLNSATYDPSLDAQIKNLNLTPAQIQAAASQSIVPGSVLAYMLGLGSDGPTAGTVRSGYTFNGNTNTWDKVVVDTTSNHVVIGTTVTGQTGPQGQYTVGTVNGQTVSLLNGTVYDATGKDITATFSASDLAKIQTALATPTTEITLTAGNINSTTYDKNLDGQINNLHLSEAQIKQATSQAINPGSVTAFMIGLGNDDPKPGTTRVGSDDNIYKYDGTTWTKQAAATPPTATGATVANNPLNVGNINTTTYSTNLNTDISGLNLTSAQIKTATAQGVAPGKVLSYMLGLGSDVPSAGTTRVGSDLNIYKFDGTNWNLLEAADAPVVLTNANLNTTVYNSALNSQISGIKLTTYPGSVTPGSVLAYMLGLGDATNGINSIIGSDGNTYVLQKTGAGGDSMWVKQAPSVVVQGKYDDKALLAGINSIKYTGDSDVPGAQIQRLQQQIIANLASYTTVTPGSVLAFMLGLGDGSNMKAGDSIKASDNQTSYKFDGKNFVIQYTTNINLGNVNTLKYDGSVSMDTQLLQIRNQLVGSSQLAQYQATGVTPGSALAFMLGLGDGSNMKAGDSIKASDGSTYTFDGKVFKLDQVKTNSEKTANASFTVVTASGKTLSKGDFATLDAPDSFTVTIKGAAANQAVVVFAGKSGTVSIANQQVGTTDANGNFTYTGNFTAADAGGWNYIFAVGDTTVGTFGANVHAPAVSGSSLLSASSAGAVAQSPDSGLKTSDITAASASLSASSVGVGATAGLTMSDLSGASNGNNSSSGSGSGSVSSGGSSGSLQASAVQNNNQSIPAGTVIFPAGSFKSTDNKVSTLGTASALATGFNGPSGLQMPTGLQMPADFASNDSSQQNFQVKDSQSYTVKKGDTLWSIAKKYYGDGKQWRKILAANPKALSVSGDTKTLKVGAQLVIPGK